MGPSGRCGNQRLYPLARLISCRLERIDYIQPSIWVPPPDELDISTKQTGYFGYVWLYQHVRYRPQADALLSLKVAMIDVN